MNSQLSSHDINLAFYVSAGAKRLINLLNKESIVIDSTRLIINDNGPNEQLNKLVLDKPIRYIEFNYSELNIKGKNTNIYISDLLLEEFKKLDIDYCFCFGYKILMGKLLQDYKNRIINIHPSILPLFPGMRSIDQALASNAFLLGNTAHFVDENVDMGPIIMQNIIHSSSFIKYDDVLNLQIVMVEQIYKWIVENRLVINGENVNIRNSDYSNIVFFPHLDI
jgi:phosphoribosylglycinamide formyltransferase 1